MVLFRKEPGAQGRHSLPLLARLPGGQRAQLVLFLPGATRPAAQGMQAVGLIDPFLKVPCSHGTHSLSPSRLAK